MTQDNKAPKGVSPERGRYRFYLVAFVAAIVVFAGSAAAALFADIRPGSWEASIFTTINGWPEGWYRFFAAITFLGSTWMALVAVAGAFVLRAYQLAWRLAVTITGAYGVAYLAKHFIGRERPTEILHDVYARIAETGMGFPSGHATLSTVIAFTAWPYLPKGVRCIVLPLGVILVCLSRLYLGVHFPLDIVGGVAIGIAAVSFLRILPQAFRKALRLD